MKKQAPVLQRKHEKENQVNKKAIIWAGAIVGVVLIAMTVLLIVNG